MVIFIGFFFMKKLFFAVTLVVSQIAGASSLVDTLKQESKLVYNHTMSKFDKNYFTFFEEWEKCEEKENQQSIDAGQAKVNAKIKENLKKDLRAVVPLMIGFAAASMIKHALDNKAGQSIYIGYDIVAGIPFGVIAGDAALKSCHLIMGHFIHKKRDF